MGKKKKYKEPKYALVHRFWLEGDDKRKLEKKSNKITDKIIKDVGVMTAVFVPGGVFDNASERALKRLSEPVPMPWGKNQSFTHGYNAAIRHAERVVREELTRHHGE